MGLSVPYIANLENGRGNPTVTALTRLAAALGLALKSPSCPANVTLPPEESPPPRTKTCPGAERTQPGDRATRTADLPSPARTHPRFRDTMTTSAAALNADADDFGRQTVCALARRSRRHSAVT